MNWAKFNRTEVLEALLFQSHIRHAVGLDTGVGMQYRPLLTDNIVVTGGVGMLVPGAGFKDIYTGRTLFSRLREREDGVLMRRNALQRRDAETRKTQRKPKLLSGFLCAYLCVLCVSALNS